MKLYHEDLFAIVRLVYITYTFETQAVSTTERFKTFTFVFCTKSLSYWFFLLLNLHTQTHTQ
jgi:hypothetical protein